MYQPFHNQSRTLRMFLQFPDAFSGQENEVISRLLLISRETQHVLVFRLLALHWLLGFMGLVMSKRKVIKQRIYATALRFYPSVFDPLALKALKLDLIAYCSILLDMSRLDNANGHIVSDVGSSEVSVVKLFEDGLESVSGFKWLPPWSTETSVAFRTFHKLLVGASSHSDAVSSASVLVESTIFHASETVPPSGLLDLYGKYMSILVEKHGPDTGLRSWSQGSKILILCHTIPMHHQTSRNFLGLSRLLAFTSLHYPDLEVRDNARIYLRMLLSVPGNKLRQLLSTGDQLPSSHSSSFFSVQSPRYSYDSKKSKDISSYIHLERVAPLLVKHSWSLSFTSFDINGDSSRRMEVIKDNNTPLGQPETPDNNADIPMIPAIEGPNQSQEPLRKSFRNSWKYWENFSSIPDLKHMSGIKFGISCTMSCKSQPFIRFSSFLLQRHSGIFNLVAYLLGEPTKSDMPSSESQIDHLILCLWAMVMEASRTCFSKLLSQTTFLEFFGDDSSIIYIVGGEFDTSYGKNLSALVVNVIGGPLINIVKDGGIISDILWNDDVVGSGLDVVAVDPNINEGSLYLKYDEEEDDRGSSLHLYRPCTSEWDEVNSQPDQEESIGCLQCFKGVCKSQKSGKRKCSTQKEKRARCYICKIRGHVFWKCPNKKKKIMNGKAQGESVTEDGLKDVVNEHNKFLDKYFESIEPKDEGSLVKGDWNEWNGTVKR
ncbi:AP-5 complex subunit beta-1 like protein [Tanacetum coccineum]